MKKIYFSSYVDVKNIQMNPEFFDEPEHDEILHRFLLTIPFVREMVVDRIKE